MYLSTSRAADLAADPPAPKGPLRAVPGTVLALGMVSLVTDVSAEMVTAVLPLYLVAGLGMSPLAFGALDGLNQGATALLRLVGGRVSDRTDRRKLVAGTGYAISAACKAALLAVTTPWSVAAVLAADRTGKGLRTAPRDALISLSCPPGEQGRAFGVHRALDTAGALLGPLAAFGVLWVAVDGYEAVFTVSCCLAVLGVLVLALFVRESPAPAPAAGTPPVRTLLRIPGLRRLCLTAAVLGLFTVGDAFLYLLLQRRLDLPTAWFPLLPVGTAAVFLLAAVPVGRLADRLGRHRVFLGGHLLLLGACLLLLAPVPPGPALVLGVLGLLGLFYAATDGVLMAAAGPLLPPGLRTTGLAVLQTAQALARFAGSLLFGAAWTLWGPGPALAAAAGGLLLALTATTLATSAPAVTLTNAAPAEEPPEG
ncbi:MULTISPECIES: MFS transporter [unclassified Streptomyces]|uniref:MFS transporter n=1 Tax=unclassified Streptomyces TaxID=2593676 RepID=UPI00202E9C2E|nr:MULTISPECIES: MFS transporter [unclassified Streptomyces]MCM1966559.1 MFS transporter [Streptomyces sp. G1]MCX5128444.1 MFS transporter [Streptomyces sp. NBC_00347]